MAAHAGASKVRLLVALLIAAMVWLLTVTGQARADDCPGATQCTVHTEPGGLIAGVEDAAGGTIDPGESSHGGPVITDATHLIDEGLDSICVETATDQGLDPFEYCGLDQDGEPPELTPAWIAAAFKRIPLPPSQLIIQPPNGRTLVNFATNFYTDNGPFDVPAFQLLGHTIELRVRPVTFAWHYGDGAIDETSDPGAAYPELRITHTYLQKGSVAPSVDTTYAATYRVDRVGPWLPVDGTVTIAGEPAQLQVLTATPTLVGYTRG